VAGPDRVRLRSASRPRRRANGRPEFDEVRDALRRDWLNERRIAANETYYQSLLQRYTVTVAGRE
jgi:hypothetical protein